MKDKKQTAEEDMLARKRRMKRKVPEGGEEVKRWRKKNETQTSTANEKTKNESEGARRGQKYEAMKGINKSRGNPKRAKKIYGEVQMSMKREHTLV